MCSVEKKEPTEWVLTISSLSRVFFPQFVAVTPQASCLSYCAQRFCCTLDVPLMGEKTNRDPMSKRKSSSVGDANDWIQRVKRSYVFMFTVCPFDVHTKTTWGPQQPTPVADVTVGLAASRLTGDFTPPLSPPCPAVPCLPPSPPYPLPSWRPTYPTTQPSISHANACLAPQNQPFHFCQPVSLLCQWSWKQPCSVKLAHHMQQPMLPTYT